MGKHVNEFISALTDLISAKLSTERRRGDYDDYAGLGEWKAEEAARAVFPAAVREALEEAVAPAEETRGAASSTPSEQEEEGPPRPKDLAGGKEEELFDFEAFSKILTDQVTGKGRKPSRR